MYKRQRWAVSIKYSNLTPIKDATTPFSSKIFLNIWNWLSKSPFLITKLNFGSNKVGFLTTEIITLEKKRSRNRNYTKYQISLCFLILFTSLKNSPLCSKNYWRVIFILTLFFIFSDILKQISKSNPYDATCDVNLNLGKLNYWINTLHVLKGSTDCKFIIIIKLLFNHVGFNIKIPRQFEVSIPKRFDFPYCFLFNLLGSFITKSSCYFITQYQIPLNYPHIFSTYIFPQFPFLEGLFSNKFTH